jgi:HSP20 family protein
MVGLTIQRSGQVPRRAREWDPFQRMQELMNLDPLELLQPWVAGREAPAAFMPTFEVKETKDAYVFKADVPGVEEKDLEVTLTGERLVVSGRREAEKREENERFYAYERTFGSFSRAFTLPEGVEAESVRAELKNGVLTLVVPKRPEVKPRTVKIDVGGEKASELKA